MTKQEREDLIAEARVFAMAAPVILPIVLRRKRDALGRLVQAHKSGNKDTATLVAEIAVLTDLETEITQKEATYRHLEESQNARRNNPK